METAVLWSGYRLQDLLRLISPLDDHVNIDLFQQGPHSETRNFAPEVKAMLPGAGGISGLNLEEAEINLRELISYYNTPMLFRAFFPQTRREALSELMIEAMGNSPERTARVTAALDSLAESREISDITTIIELSRIYAITLIPIASELRGKAPETLPLDFLLSLAMAISNGALNLRPVWQYILDQGEKITVLSGITIRRFLTPETRLRDYGRRGIFRTFFETLFFDMVKIPASPKIAEILDIYRLVTKIFLKNVQAKGIFRGLYSISTTIRNFADDIYHGIASQRWFSELALVEPLTWENSYLWAITVTIGMLANLPQDTSEIIPSFAITAPEWTLDPDRLTQSCQEDFGEISPAIRGFLSHFTNFPLLQQISSGFSGVTRIISSETTDTVLMLSGLRTVQKGSLDFDSGELEIFPFGLAEPETVIDLAEDWNLTKILTESSFPNLYGVKITEAEFPQQ